MKSGTKYGLQLRGPPAGAAKKTLPPPPKLSIFSRDDDDDEESVEQEIARQAAKNRSLEQVSLLHQAALEQDSTAFSYDEVYDDIKAKSAPSRREANSEGPKSRYIPKLLEKAKARQQEQEIIYERKLLKEREQEDHLYGDKEKYVTTAYKQKLAEQSMWLEEEKERERREEADEVTKKKDLGDFYQNLLSKNVAFGASTQKGDMSTAPKKALRVEQQEPAIAVGHSTDPDLDMSSQQKGQALEVQSDDTKEADVQEGDHHERSSSEKKGSMSPHAANAEPDNASEVSQKSRGKDSMAADIPAKAERKPSEGDLSAARERYLARKRVRTA